MIPSSIGKLCNLKHLSLPLNNWTLGLPDFLERSDECVSRHPLPSLESLYLWDGGLSGNLPEWLGELANLENLDLSLNSFRGPIPRSLGYLSNLKSLNLQGNALTGALPPTLGQLSELVNFDVSSNQLTGIVSEAHFANLEKLKSLNMYSNSLVINVSSDWNPPFQVNDLRMASCQLGPQFPTWIRNQKELKNLDFSNSSISDSIPAWFWNLSPNLYSLNISFNRIRGQLPNPVKVGAFAIDMSSNLLHGLLPPLQSDGADLLDLSDNQFSGPIPHNIGELLPNLNYLSLSNNYITGGIPTSIGGMQVLQVLRLSNNNLTGIIPLSLQNCSNLKAVSLEYNNLSGVIPPLFGGLNRLESLHLSNNRLFGEIPMSLQNCSSLEILDLGYNGFRGNIPTWIGNSLPSLRILRLRSNGFSGEIPSQLSNLSSLQVLDLAENRLVGRIPRAFEDLAAMVHVPKNKYMSYVMPRGKYYQERLSLHLKDQTIEYTKILFLVTCIDLSRNKLSGGFPKGLTNLSDLLALDLSRNRFHGKIPHKIANMRELSSLDLSNNNFSGRIPPSMSSMSFLSYLNLSNNNFSGRIPFSGQLSTSVASSYYGNLYLCGPPLAIGCREDDDDGAPVSDNNRNEGDDESADEWLYLSIGLGFMVGLLGPFAVLSIRRPWISVYFSLVDRIIGKISEMKATIILLATRQ